MNLLHQFQFGVRRCSGSNIFPSPLINQNHSVLPVSVTCYHFRRERIEMAIPVPTSVPARDRVIDFGKYKGKMLGTLPSSYLKWVSKNLRARDFEEWAKLADQVLGDPIYGDRIEWEFAQNVLDGNQLNFKSLSFSRPTAVPELMEISERFGWDNQDKVGWSKVDFQLLGTTKGGRIPRREPKQKDPVSVTVSDEDGAEARTRSRRMERRERQKTVRLRRETQQEGADQKKNMNVDDDGTEDGARGQDGIGNPFPGREALLRKAINRTRARGFVS